MQRKQSKMDRLKKTVSYQAILLGVSTLIATTLLSFGNLATKDAIAQRLIEDLEASISQVIPTHLYDNELLDGALEVDGPDGEKVVVYRATRNGEFSAAIFEVSENGYSGTIRSILAVTPEGEILGVRVLAHTETPGLGDKIEIAKDDWILGFNGRTMNNPPKSAWRVKKDGGEFDQFTGATITPRAVVASVRGGLEFYETQKNVLKVPQSNGEAEVNNELP